MEYESDRVIAEIEMEDAKTKAMDDFEEYLGLKGEEQDPNWVKPAHVNEIQGISIDQVPEGQWISNGRTGTGPKDEPMANETFDHDLPSLVKDGPKELPAIPNTPLGKLTASDTDKLIKARTGPTDEDLANLLDCTVLDMYKRIAGGLYSKENLIKAYKSGLRSV
jgi:hypothetical protein